MPTYVSCVPKGLEPREPPATPSVQPVQVDQQRVAPRVWHCALPPKAALPRGALLPPLALYTRVRPPSFHSIFEGQKKRDNYLPNPVRQRPSIIHPRRNNERKIKNEFSTWDSHMVTHCSTNQAIRCLFTAERTGCETFIVLWPNTTLVPPGDSLTWTRRCQGDRTGGGLINRCDLLLQDFCAVFQFEDYSAAARGW